MGKQTRAHKHASGTTGLSTRSLNPIIKSRTKNLRLGRCRFPLEELGDIPAPPKVRLDRYQHSKPKDRVFIDDIILQILETIRVRKIIYSQAVHLVSQKMDRNWGTINNRFASYATEAEHKAADVVGAVRRRRFNKLREILTDKNIECECFTDACRLIAENEFIGEITQIDVITITNQFRGMADNNLRELVYKRWPHIGLGREKD